MTQRLTSHSMPSPSRPLGQPRSVDNRLVIQVPACHGVPDECKSASPNRWPLASLLVFFSLFGISFSCCRVAPGHC